MIPSLQYCAPLPWTRSHAERAFASADPTIVCDALVGVTFYDPDRAWVEGWLLRLANHSDVGVRALVATCIGHLARIHHAVHPVLAGQPLDRLAEDPAVAGRVNDARDDLRMFLPAQ